MKKNQSYKLALLAIAGVFCAEGAAQAAATSYTDGDLFLGFRATSGTGATITYLIDIGQGSIYRDATTSFNLSLGNIAQDLNNFGASGAWATNSALQWGVFGAYAVDTNGNDTNTIYATKAEATVGTLTTAWNRRSDSSQATTQAKVQNLASAYLSATSTANSTVGALINTSSPNDWSEFMPGGSQSTAGTAFAVYAPTIEGNFANGAAGTRLDLYSMVSGATTAGTYEGSFQINSSGQVSFNVVPEPASLSMLALSVGMVGFVRRRQKANA